MLFAKVKSIAENVPGRPDGQFIASDMKVLAMNSDLIPDDLFRIPPRLEVKARLSACGWSLDADGKYSALKPPYL
jgi:hypothetical protein